jgi:tRNA nucleotidyltransferase (CCA-adding enzyme)
MCDMVQHGEVDHLVAERVWQELARGLMEAQPSRMFEVLRACGALQRLMPELHRLWDASGTAMLHRLDTAARLQTPVPVRFACLARDLAADAISSLCERLRVPTDCRDLAELLAREQDRIEHSATLNAAGLMALLERCDAIRQPERFAQALQACECVARAQPESGKASYPPALRLAAALRAARAVATNEVAQQAMARGVTGPAVGALIHAARVAALTQIN